MKAVGASGAAAGLATGPVGAVTSQGATIQWVANQEAEQASDAITEALYEAGLSQDIELDIVAGSNISDDVRSQFQQWLSSGREQPDIMRMDNGWTIPFIAREQLLNLSENLPQETLDTVEEDYFDSMVQTATGDDGDLYGVPLFIDVPTMQYRKDLVEDAGYDPEGENWATESISWQEFSEVTSTVLDENDDIDMGFTFQAQAYEGLACCTFNEFMSSFGGAYFGGMDNLFGPVGDRPVTVDEQPVVDSIEMIRAFIHGPDAENASSDFEGPIAPQAVLQWTETPSISPFTNGNAVMHRNWGFGIDQNGAEENFGEDLGVMPIPYGVTEDEAEYEGTGGPVAALGGWNNVVNPNSPNVEAALEVIRAFTADNVQLTILEESGWLPPKAPLFESDRAAEVPVMGRYMDSLQVAAENAIPRPVTVVWPQQAQRVAQQVNDAYSEGGSPQENMTTLSQQLEQIEQRGS